MPPETPVEVIAKPKKRRKRAAHKKQKKNNVTRISMLIASARQIKLPSTKYSMPALIVLLVFALGFSQYRLFFGSSTPAAVNAAAQTPAQVITDIGSVMVLPQGETPQIAVVQDVEKMRAQQPFFNRALNGDQVLMYSDMVILYRPSERKIVNVTEIQATPVATSSNATTTAATSSEKIAAPKATSTSSVH